MTTQDTEYFNSKLHTFQHLSTMDQVQIQSNTQANALDHPSSPQQQTPRPDRNPPTTPQKRTFTIRPATKPSDISTARTLFELYRTWLDIDLSFQNYEEESANLPGKYAAREGGVLLIAWDGEGSEGEGEGSEEEEGGGDENRGGGEKGSGKALGCVALRTLGDHHPSSSSPSSSSSSTPSSRPAGEVAQDNKVSSTILTSQPEQRTYAELKRLYVLPTARNRGEGKALVTEAVRRARDELNVDGIRMDALREKSREAMGLYERLGFGECEAYYENLVEGVVFLELLFDDDDDDGTKTKRR